MKRGRNSFHEAVNDLLRQASQLISETTTPGFLEIWDGSDGNLLRQYAVPTVDALAPTPVFTYNSLASGAMSPFGTGWVMHYLLAIGQRQHHLRLQRRRQQGHRHLLHLHQSQRRDRRLHGPAQRDQQAGRQRQRHLDRTQPDGLTLNNPAEHVL